MHPVLYYYRHKNMEGRHLVGVPLRDLYPEDLEGMPAHMLRSIEASKLYYKTRPDGWRSQEDLDAADAAAAAATKQRDSQQATTLVDAQEDQETLQADQQGSTEDQQEDTGTTED